MLVDGIQRATRSAAGKVASVVFIILSLGVGFYVIRNSLKSDTPDSAFSVTYIDTENGKAFQHRPVAGETSPIVSPYSGKNTGVMGEPCYWTASGQPKTDPTWVLLNEAVGKSGPTFCPDCGRLVVGHNPRPAPGRKPPPTQQEYMAHHVSPAPSAAARESRD
jgi:hypothetical protein